MHGNSGSEWVTPGSPELGRRSRRDRSSAATPMPYDLITPGILNLSNGTFNSAPTQENLMPIELRGLCPELEVFAKPTWVRFCRVFPGSALIENAPRGPVEFGWGLFRSAQSTPIMLNSAYDSGERPEVSDPARITAHLDTGRRLRQSRSRRRLPASLRKKPQYPATQSCLVRHQAAPDQRPRRLLLPVEGRSLEKQREKHAAIPLRHKDDCQTRNRVPVTSRLCFSKA
jgi:hypothetical protein